MSLTDKTSVSSSPGVTDSRLATLCSEQVRLCFLDYQAAFEEISRRARQRFLDRDWRGSFADASERLHIYNARLDTLVETVRELMGKRLHERHVWMAIKAVYSSFIAQSSHWEVAESFFNSLTRRVFATEGVDQAIEFVDSDFDAPPTALSGRYRRLRKDASLPVLLRAVLTDAETGGFDAERWEALDLQLEQATERIMAVLPAGEGEYCAEMIATTFFRGRGAYLVGRLWREGEESRAQPLALCLKHPSPRGINLDAVLVEEEDLSVLFSYTRAYFRVEVRCPYELVRDLRALIPHKPLVDLYNAIGYHRHGKTELYRDFVNHMKATRQRFVAADGARGMVMLVFTLPTYDVVFKLIKDRFDFPKNVTPDEVKQRYRLVFEHDRAGRLVEAHEFEHLRIPRGRFEDSLVEMMLAQCGKTVELEGRDVLISHAYVERRVRPLNLYWAEAPEDKVIRAALDYGQAIKDLAASNVFAGDIFPKNFGVTRTGRVVFYDYDELCPLTDCNFRRIPKATTYDEEMSAEPWFSVRENDIFPEEFPKFLGLPEVAKAAFHEQHGDLFSPEFWQGVQAKLRKGVYPEVYPYEASCRLPQPSAV